MQEITKKVYVADDGKEFEDVQACINYECNLHAYDDDLAFYSITQKECWRVLTIGQNVYNCNLIIVKTADGARQLKIWCRETGVVSEFDDIESIGTGVLYYDSGLKKWIDWERYYNEIVERNNEILKLINCKATEIQWK